MPRVATFVLDTNAWLDLLVFGDTALSGFTDSVVAGEVRVVIDGRAFAELERVLRYDTVRIDEATAASCVATVRALAQSIPVPAMALPKCRDPDDQMFLEIAVCSNADALLTRDAELLRMARRMARDHGLAIVAPAAWRDVVAQMSKR
ncbi:putative toxin-antitoxin system toxin component, PIN family [Lysobacter claricitrinus]|uniref:putative toxin-antitoxin system toxin component, PIN family n=1 Tax=Lysobacter claricitrinus TaxID=3367728 RepID=UPI0037DAA52E